MKKAFVMALALTLGLAISSYAGDDNLKVKQQTKTKGDVTTTTTQIKDTTTGEKIKETVVTTDTTERSKQEVKGKNLKMKKEEIATPESKAGLVKFDVKKGAITDMQIEWVYRQEGDNYVTEYTIKDKNNEKLLKELNLTPAQAFLIVPGVHKIISTSPYTGQDVRSNIQAVILKDLKTAVKK